MAKYRIFSFPGLLLLSVMSAFIWLSEGCDCHRLPPADEIGHLPQRPEIFPDYQDITIPPNIAPLNFMVKGEGERFSARFEGVNGSVIQLAARDRVFRIPPGAWGRFLEKNRGGAFVIRVFRKMDGRWSEFGAISIRVAPEPIDPYVVYRLIPPGYETWSTMGLYQRDLTTFSEDPVIENRYIEDDCVNCHSFCDGNSENMLFHIRGSLGGTMIKKGETIEKVNLKTEETISAGVYPSWHPSGDYIAFSTNKIEQYFHAHPDKTIEVLDRHSDLILYNTIQKTISHVPGTEGDAHMETYPCWSPDGTWLYFSRSDANAETPFDSIRYDIYRIGFDPGTGRFGTTEPVFIATGRSRSASFPEISPDGRHLLCTVHDYGTFPIWHREADLCLVDLETGKWEIPDGINSDQTESYHGWSGNSRWIIFSSRRYDGQYTRLYISYINSEGQFQKAFLVPQKDPRFYDSFFYSYNRPVLITGSIRVDQRRWIKAAIGQ
jgi:Tol biopolymer transport system component